MDGSNYKVINQHRDAILQYLNINRDKFNERGEFNPDPDTFDLPPYVLSSYGVVGKLPGPNSDWEKRYGKGKIPDDRARKMNENQKKDELRNVRYSREACKRIWRRETDICFDGFFGEHKRLCQENANRRLTLCSSNGHHNGFLVYTLDQATGQAQDKNDPERKQTKPSTEPKGNSKPNQNPKPKPDDKSSKFSWKDLWPTWLRSGDMGVDVEGPTRSSEERYSIPDEAVPQPALLESDVLQTVLDASRLAARAKAKLLKIPLVEGSVSPELWGLRNRGALFPPPQSLRPPIRATPGMGFGGGGGKLPLLPRGSLDPRVPLKIY